MFFTVAATIGRNNKTRSFIRQTEFQTCTLGMTLDRRTTMTTKSADFHSAN
jgi:hypothetical protein